MKLLDELDEIVGPALPCVSETLNVLKALGLHERNWRSVIRRLPGRITGDYSILTDDEIAIDDMFRLVELKHWKIKRAAECTVARNGLYRGISWDSAVKRARNAWNRRKPEQLSDVGRDSDSAPALLHIVNPCWCHDEMIDLFFNDALIVKENTFWRRAIELGLVAELKTGK